MFLETIGFGNFCRFWLYYFFVSFVNVTSIKSCIKIILHGFQFFNCKILPNFLNLDGILCRYNNMQLLSYGAECNMENIFRVSHILQLISRAFSVVCFAANQHDNWLIPFFTLINTIPTGNIVFFKFITQTHFFTL